MCYVNYTSIELGKRWFRSCGSSKQSSGKGQASFSSHHSLSVPYQTGLDWRLALQLFCCFLDFLWSTYMLSAGCFVGWSFWGIIVGLFIVSLSHLCSSMCIFFLYLGILEGNEVSRVVLQGNQTTLDKIIPAPFLTHFSTLAWRIPWTGEPGGLQSMGLQRVGHDWATSLWLFTFMHWRRKWQPTPVFLPGESQGRQSLMGCCLWGRTESDTTEAT